MPSPRPEKAAETVEVILMLQGGHTVAGVLETQQLESLHQVISDGLDYARVLQMDEGNGYEVSVVVKHIVAYRYKW